MGLFSRKKTDKPNEKPIIKELFKPADNFLTFNPYVMVEVALYQDHLTLRTPISADQTIYSINYTQITDVFYGVKREIVKKDKSPIGRAVAGGLLFGGVGAVVGAVSGVGEKNTTKFSFNFIISYTSSSGEEKFLPFEDTRQFLGQKLSNKLTEFCGLNETKQDPNSKNVNL